MRFRVSAQRETALTRITKAAYAAAEARWLYGVPFWRGLREALRR
jgi:hypothetical protein